MPESLRRYIANQTELAEYVTIAGTFDAATLRKAELDIDKAVAIFYEGGYAPFLFGEILEVESSEIALTANNATLTGFGWQAGYLDRSVLEIRSGSDAGKRIFVESQTISGDDRILTFADTQTGLSGSPICRIYQEAKFPRVCDTEYTESTYTKTIPEWLKEAVALQYNFRVNNAQNLENVNQLSGYSVSKDSYSENFDTAPSGNSSIRDRLSPEAMDILDCYGLTAESI